MGSHMARSAALFALTTLLTLDTGCLCQSREEKLKAAEEQGNTIAATKAKLAKGVGEAMKREGKEAMETVSEGVGEMVKGIGSGVNKGLLAVKLDVAPELAGQGVAVTRASRLEAENAVSVYITFDNGYTGPLELRVFDEKDLEVGRARAELNGNAGGAQYVDFTFDRRTPLLTAKRFELRAGKK